METQGRPFQPLDGVSSAHSVGNPVDPRAAHRLLLACFFLSGFAALLYQTVWMRLALAKFGVNTSVVATVLAVFMLGLALGTFLAGRYVERFEARFRIGSLRIYGLAELVVGLGGFSVPHLLSAGRDLLLAAGPADSGAYTALSTVLLSVVLLPFCTAMGLTFPTAIAFLKRSLATAGRRDPFSALYVANVAGALMGAVVTPLFLIEFCGFLATSFGAVCGNFLVAFAALAAFRGATLPPAASAASAPVIPLAAGSGTRRLALFITGFCTMGMEVLWTRIYPTIIGTFVYSFAAILAIYLVATTAGTVVYRRFRRREWAGRIALWWPWLCAASLLPLLSASVTLPPFNGLLRVLLGLTPFCALLGFLTPALVDQEAGDDPDRVGRAYGINLIGCLIGPIVAGIVLLPTLGTRGAAFVLVLPLFLFLLVPSMLRDARPLHRLVALGLAVAFWFSTTLFEEMFPRDQVRYDHVATVAAGESEWRKDLFVNGVGMTSLTSITKMMAHFPLAHLAPRQGASLDTLAICFGMGTSFRSLASWGANVTAVELVPSVPEFFGFYFPDGPGLLREAGKRLRIEHDDGRRFLDRSPQSYDVITIDPPPPVEAAASSLLYSTEFYTSAARRMKPGAILQTWLPWGDRQTIAGVTLALLESFPHVRVFSSIEGSGYHFLASEAPIQRLSAEDLVSRMPEAAVRDMTEWVDEPPASFFQFMLDNEHLPDSLLIGGSGALSVAIRDDRPVNEFFFVRRYLTRRL